MGTGEKDPLTAKWGYSLSFSLGANPMTVRTVVLGGAFQPTPPRPLRKEKVPTGSWVRRHEILLCLKPGGKAPKDKAHGLFPSAKPEVGSVYVSELGLNRRS